LLHSWRAGERPMAPIPIEPDDAERKGSAAKNIGHRKFGSWERSLELDAKVIAVGESEGIHFAFDKIERTPNTVDAHRLIWLADQNDCQDAVVEALFRAYFTDGRDIGNRQTLIDVAAEAGLERQVAEAMLDSDEGMNVISNAREMSQRHQVTGVPFFIINKAIALSGAQEPGTFLDAFKHGKLGRPRFYRVSINSQVLGYFRYGRHRLLQLSVLTGMTPRWHGGFSFYLRGTDQHVRSNAANDHL
jgi:predicted DsbA family dithiol-disulfide isomerase